MCSSRLHVPRFVPCYNATRQKTKGRTVKTIEVETPIPENGILTLHVPPGAEPGDEIHVRLMTTSVATQERPPLDLPLHHVGP